MDVFEDTLDAFDEVGFLLSRDPRAYPKNPSFPDTSSQDAYWMAMMAACDKLRAMLEHVAEEGVDLPSTYAWRVFREKLAKNFYFTVPHASVDEGARDEGKKALKRARAAMVDIAAAHELLRDAQVPTKPSAVSKLEYERERLAFENELKNAELAATPEAKPEPKKKRENVGYGWPIKLAFSGGLAAAAYALLPHLISHSDSFAKDRITLTLGVFGAALALANVIRKP